MSFESFGVRVRVSAETEEILERIRTLLPPDAVPISGGAVGESFGIRADAGGSYRFERGDSPVARDLDLEFALVLMESQLRIYVGHEAPGKVFVHAGVVAHDGVAIVLPGMSFTGKTTLVLALLRAGAIYYSDEFAVIDQDGFVHPFPKQLSVRNGGDRQVDHPVEAFGGVPGEQPLRVGLVAFTEYRPGATWEPARLTRGRGVLEMLANTLSARRRPEEAFRVFNRALDGAILLEGERGEAEDMVQPLLAAVCA